MIHEQATDQPFPEQGQPIATRRTGRLSGMIKHSVLQNRLFCAAFVIMPYEPRNPHYGGLVLVVDGDCQPADP